MPRPTYPRDRFDELADDTGRIGAHRAENPRMRGGVVFLWAAIATVVLLVGGIFGALVVSGRITLVPEPVASSTPLPIVTPVLDTTFSVVILNATPEEGLATQVRDTVIAAGWPAESVLASGAGTEDFPTTTVYYADAEDESAAAGLAEAIGGADIAQSDQYLQPDDPATEEDESARQLTVVLGLDRVAGAAETPAE